MLQIYMQLDGRGHIVYDCRREVGVKGMGKWAPSGDVGYPTHTQSLSHDAQFLRSSFTKK